MSTRAGATQTRAASGSTNSSALETRVNGLEVSFRNLEEQFSRTEYAERTRERIQQLVSSLVETPFGKIDDELARLAELNKKLQGQLEASNLASMKQELQSLKKDIAELRTSTQAEVTLLWRHISKLEEPADTNQEPGTDGAGIAPRPDAGSRNRHSAAQRSASRKKKTSSRRHARRKSKNTGYETDSSSDSPLSSDAEESDLDDIQVADEACRKVMQVETYRLQDRNPDRDPRMKVTRTLADLRHLFSGEMFDGSDPLSLLHFLQDLKQTFDDAALAEGDAKHMVRYFLTGEAATLFKGLSTNERGSYRRILRWLLRTYIREGTIQNAREKFLTRAQGSSETEVEYSKTLSNLAHRCGGLIQETELTNRYIRGLQPAIRTHVQSKLSGVQSWAIAVATASEYGDAHREEVAARTKPRTPRFVTVQPRRSLTGTSRKALLTHPEPVKPEPEDESEVDFGDLGDLVDLQEHEDNGSGGDPVGAIHWGASPLVRSPSLGSQASSGGSSDAMYRTPPQTRSPSGPSPAQAKPPRRIMLPPGVPFPAKPPPKGPARPCIGCHQHGHWIVNCPHTNAQVKEMVLEALRARKQLRQQTRVPTAAQPTVMPRRFALTIHDEGGELPPDPVTEEAPPEESG